jgi:DNA-binding transcriptional LysR family regulator
MELRHLRYFVGAAEEEHFGRAAERLGIAQPALSRQIQDLEKELGFTLFDRLARGVKLNAAGKLYLSDARRILQDVHEARRRAERVATGKAGTLRVGFGETQSWHGVVPNAFRRFRQRNPDAELELYPMPSPRLLEAIQSGKLDAAFVFSLTPPPAGVARRQVAQHKLILAAPRGYPVTRLKRLKLGDLHDTPLIWFQRWVDPLFCDRLMAACIRGGLTSPRIVQEVPDHATMLSLVSCRLGTAFVSEATRWQCPRGVALRPIVDLDFTLPFYLIWQRENGSPLLRNFLAQDQGTGSSVMPE